MIKKVEQTILNFIWNGKNQKYTLYWCITAYYATNNGTIRSTDHIQYSPPNDHTQVQRLLNSIQLINNQSSVQLSQPFLNDNIKRIFLSAVDFLLLVAPQHTISTDTNFNISAVKLNFIIIIFMNDCHCHCLRNSVTMQSTGDSPKRIISKILLKLAKGGYQKRPKHKSAINIEYHHLNPKLKNFLLKRQQ